MEACDIACQRNKQLSSLQIALHKATVNKNKDPEAYEQARINYYTVKDGEGWLRTEKEKKANMVIDPIIAQYQQKYIDMQVAEARQQAKEQARKDVQNEQVGDEDDIRFVHDLIQKQHDSAGVHRRLLQLGGSNVEAGPSWLPTALDVTIGLLILGVVYYGYRKYSQ
jgi:hypothetical protein